MDTDRPALHMEEHLGSENSNEKTQEWHASCELLGGGAADLRSMSKQQLNRAFHPSKDSFVQRVAARFVLVVEIGSSVQQKVAHRNVAIETGPVK